MELLSKLLNCIQNKILPNRGILINGVLIPKLLNNPFASYSLINIDILISHIVHFDKSIVLPLIVFEILGCMFPVLFYTLNKMIALLYIQGFKLFCLIILLTPILLPSSIRLFF